ncbi:F0F1 ATP synthase subunit B [Candidatus Palauibacter sp.]|uniref:F0F1 ATP synthase subunit B n=1 Tax=Candidatus Palauibacter sp. TaxID=3101350 RepID=UPI003B012359
MMRSAGVAGCWALATPLVLAAQTETGIFSLNLGLFVWTIVLFVLTLVVLAKWVFPLIAGGLEQRHDKIQGAIDDALSARDEAKGLLSQQEAALEAARSEAREMLENARRHADGLRKEMLEEARAQQAQMLDDARREIGHERDRLREEIRRDAVDLALAASERLIRARLDAEENRRLVHEFVSDV